MEMYKLYQEYSTAKVVATLEIQTGFIRSNVL